MLQNEGIISHFGGETPIPEIDAEAEQPLRMELFSIEQRRERGKAVSHEHQIADQAEKSDRLLTRLEENKEVIRDVHRRFVDDVTAKRPITSVGEWLVDNFYVVEEQISLCERHLPKKYLLELPRLANPGKKGIPRVYDLAEHVISYGDGRMDIEDLSVFIASYQEIAPLKLGELWAVPIMLRLALIENIRRISVLAQANRNDRDAARRWADEMVRVGDSDPKNLILTIADMARARPSLSGSFVAEFKRLLQGRGASMKLPLQWVEQNLNENDLSIDQTVNDENHAQAVLEMSMRNCINSLRSLNVTDWNEFVEVMSVVEKTLRLDPADVYPKMDFATRNDYRRTVESLSRKSGQGEGVVARTCLALAREAAKKDGAQSDTAHVGYYLIGGGEQALMHQIGFRMGIGDYLRHFPPRFTLGLYLGAILFLTSVFTLITALIAHASGVRGDMLLVLGIFLAFATLHLATGLVNFMATQLVHPRPLPRMDYAKGIPPEMRTLVVVPVIVGAKSNIDKMIANLETHYLNNRGDNIHFGLLTDFNDAVEETTQGDEEILSRLRSGVERLNEKYPDDGGNNFFLFHRPRKWNENEKIWMGWERKRGKLEDLNRYLTGEDDGAFSHVIGRAEVLSNVSYVITLDADTQMARDSAWQLVGTMAHPLIRPQYDEKMARVVRGHGILQPRVESALSGATRSRYARMCSQEIGIDPYTKATSDVYQDLFDEGSFIGKGIYDVKTFAKALGGRFPDNKILSHDLLEGCVVRSGLVSDVKLYEDPPATYMGDVMRRHRWVRGDWQIASYLIASETRRGFRMTTHPLNILSQWKVFDNLRRSLTAPALLLLLVGGLTVLTNPGLYLLVVSCVFLIPVFVGAACGLVRKSPDKTLLQHIRTLVVSTLREAEQVFFRFACLPYEAYVNADAIVRSLWRQCVSRRHLLQWNPFDNSISANFSSFSYNLRRMWIGPVAAVVMAAVMARKNPGILCYAAPLLLLWLISPLFAAWLSGPLKVRREYLDSREVDFLRRTARRIWLFFEDFVNADENWLPPDNYQEYPAGKIAHRTSPTNMGLSLLSNLSALDFGFVSAGRFLYRTEQSLKTMFALDRFRGHFFNWYDTRTMSVLRPAYVSTVDSGNLAAHLLVLAAGMDELAKAKIVDGRTFAGLRDTLELAAEEADNPASPALLGIDAIRAELSRDTAGAAASLPEYRAALNRVAEGIESVLANCDKCGKGEARSRRWLAAFSGQCQDALGEIDSLAPWVMHMGEHAEWAAYPELADIPTLEDVAGLAESMNEKYGRGLPANLVEMLESGAERAEKRLEQMRMSAMRCRDFADIDFEFLYDESKRLLSIGYNADEHRLDASYYDLLASEARMAAYLGIVQHKIPQESWWALGRMLTLSGRHPLLVSWSGSMFEYLMPLLVMPTFSDTLLDETCKACVSVQMEYGADRGVAWGISESGYNVFDSDQNYQYRAFGVPELGLKHGLSQDLVIAPYASVMATMVYPERACANLKRLADEGYLTSRGFYEAVDFTSSRLPYGSSRVLVRSHMAHHQGMSLVALGQALLGRPMHRRFNADPLLRSGIMLLQEMVPAEKAMYYHSTYTPELRAGTKTEETPMRILRNPNTPHPEVQLLSNGNYHVMVTASGGGYSRWQNFALTRWREDATRDNWGTFCYLRDRENDNVWSTTYQPTHAPAKHFEALFSEGKAEFNRRDSEFDSHTEIVVSPEDDVEVRRVRITNLTGRRKLLDLTSYAEVVLAKQADDDSHQAFSKLFVQTEFLRDRQAIVCSRRPRQPSEKTPLMFHMLAVRGTEGGAVTFETDRLRFLGRGNDASRPSAVCGSSTGLAGGKGAVLDPIVSICTSLTLDPGGSAVIDIMTGVAPDRETLKPLLEKYQDQRMADKAFDLAWSHGQLLLRQLNISETEAQRFCQLAGSIVYANPAVRAEPSVISRNTKGQSGLWSYAISGDLPIVLLKIEDPSRLHLVNQMIQAHTYWRQKGLVADLVIWNEDKTSYRQTLHDQIMGLAGAVLEDGTMEHPGGIFLRSGDRISEEDRVLLQSAARVVISDSSGMIDEQMRRQAKSEMNSSTTIVQYRKPEPRPSEQDDAPVEELLLDNGYGGFSPDGREYVIVTGERGGTPLPWVNVMANEKFGTVVSESGSSYTWGENAHGFRLSPWHNDPVSDTTGEAIYIRDEMSGDYWSPTPQPCRSGRQYVARHGFGYSTFLHNEFGIQSRLTVHVDRAASVKFMTLRLKNRSNARRSLSATAYIEWVLGDLRTKTGMHVVTGVDNKSGTLLARNQYVDEFRGRTAFLDTDDPGRTVTGDRREFLGRNGSLAQPLAMQRANLSGKVGASLDPCGAVQVRFSLAPGQEREVVFRLGEAENHDEARKLIRQFRGPERAHESLEAVKDYWRETLGAIEVETPDMAFNLMANGWLLYQALSCRFWGRSATYQSGGAFGFRDQLQDSMAFLYSEPGLVRSHLLECAAHQFVEGDVMHWWHPPGGRGVRTRCSDDYLWLPFVAERYASVTGDSGVWDETVRFIQGRPVPEGEESYYDLPQRSEEKATLYEHCRRSILNGLRFGEHGLPLMGTGDWNDGMDRVGAEGKGESVWLAFFLHYTLEKFEPVARARDDGEFADRCREEAGQLSRNIEAHAWDDEWYRRAYFDDGTPLGSALNPECRIDSLAQSWAVLSGVGDPKRASAAMHSLDERLVDRRNMIVKLFEPPFDTSDLNPGYIKGYVPGVRENGGQYTHAAVWAAMAFARMGDRQKAWELQKMINPLNHALDRPSADVYMVEPYVVSADVYAAPQHTGRGGWSWYTGSASWLYRFMIESILGFNLEAETIRLTPCVPSEWNGFRLKYRRGQAVYDINVSRSQGADGTRTVNNDNVNANDVTITIDNDQKEHKVEVEL